MSRHRLLKTTSVLVGVLVGCGAGPSQTGAEGAGGDAGAKTSGASGSGGATGGGGTQAAGGSGSQTVSGSGGSGVAGSTGGSAGASQAGSASMPTGTGQSGPISCRTKGDGKSTITFVNQCDATLAFRGSKITGGELLPGEHACRDVGNAVESIPAIRFWGFIGMDPGGEKYTLAELTLNTDFNDFDWYNISHVDASNLPMRVAPVDMDKCRVLTCAKSLLADCPAIGQLKDANGKVISCVSPDRNNPNSPVAQYFEASCKDAYSWSGDDSESVAACAGEDYDVVFCP